MDDFCQKDEIDQRFISPTLRRAPAEWNETFTESSLTVSEHAVKIA